MMISVQKPLLLFTLLLLLASSLAWSQNLDSLLNNKRVYQTENIGEKPSGSMESWSFQNPDFRWEYKLGSTLYLVWAHDRSGFESVYNPLSDISGDLFGMKGNNVFMFKLNFWFSV